ncbi:MAG: cyclohexanecarboxylate-CoA ligase [Actinomycetota bacterium]|nr:cyclohexanecarboxylate-CoA ligase [Actinomycetota bacterium]
MIAAMTEPLYDARTFWELVSRRAAVAPDHPMLIDTADRTVTFGEFAKWAERVAAGFAALGVREGTTVSWQLPTRIETVVASMALSRLGAVQNPIIHIYREREVRYVLQDSGAELFLVPGEWRGFDYCAMAERIVADLDRPVQVLEAYDTLPEGDPSTLPRPPAPPSGGNAPIRWLYYTSGTTANPKGVRHTDETLIAGAVGLAVALDMSPDDVGSMAFPFAHIAGPDYLGTMLILGFPAVVLEAFVPTDAVEAYSKHNVTMAGGSTAFYTAFLTEQRKQPETKIIPSLRLLSGGGAPKPPELFFEVQREIGVPVAHGYGMTECPMISQGSPHDTDEQLANSDGAPVRGCEIKIALPDESAAKANAEGEVRVRGPMVCKGYTDPALIPTAFDDAGYFRTGDLGYLRDDGHIVLTGRIKDIIIRKGENIAAKDIEDLLYQHPKVAEVAVIGLPDRERGERVCAVVQTAADFEPLTFVELQQYCRDSGMMTQKIPEQLEFVDVMPRNATLKILKYELRDRFAT